MSILFIALLLALATAALLTIRRNRRALDDESVRSDLAPHPAAGLFSYSDEATGLNETRIGDRREGLLERAAKGELVALRDAQLTGDSSLYQEVLNHLVDHSSGRQEDLDSLVTLIAKSNELRASIKLSRLVIGCWEADPYSRSPVEVLHLAALSDDAATYRRAVEVIIERWRGGLIERLSAGDLIELIESHYWLLAPEARSGGDGFRLRRRLKKLSRDLSKMKPVS